MSLFNLAARAGIPAARSAMRFLSTTQETARQIGTDCFSWGTS